MCDKNPQKIKNMFNEISQNYDKINNFISLGTHYLIKSNAIKKLNPKSKSQLLDICCGTGDFTKIISKMHPHIKVIGIDFSQNMLKIAKQKNPKGVFLQADAANLPFKDEEFDYITIGFGLRNIENRQLALKEIYRVLKPNGKFLHLDFGKHNLYSKIFDTFVPKLVKMLGGNSQHYQYLLQSKNSYPEPDKLIDEFCQNNFQFVSKYDYIFDAISVQVMKKI